MRRLVLLLFFAFINMGLLLAQQETPVVTKALRDSIQERLKLSRRYSTNSRSVDFKLARRHITRALQLNDSLQLHDADVFAAAGDVEHLAFNYERNKPASGGKIDQAVCLSSAKQCYLYYLKADSLYQADAHKYGKNGVKQRVRIQQLMMQYFLQTKGFEVNASSSFKKGDLTTSLQEFQLSFAGCTSPILNEIYNQDPKRLADYAHYLADSTQCRALYNCATVSSALGRLDESLAYYDSLKVRGYAPEKVYRNTMAIYTSRHDTLSLISELNSAIERLPHDSWFHKNLLQIYIDRQQWLEAETLADRILAFDSIDAQTLCVRGQLYELRGDIDEAMTHYLKSYEIDSTQAKVCSFIGRIYYNRSINLKTQLYDQHKSSQIDKAIQPIYDEALPWYQRAYEFDTSHKDKTIPTAIREMLYSRFTKARCPNRTELIALYDEVSKAYGLPVFGK